MFTELVPLVRASDKVVITLTMHGDAMSVVVLPVIKNAADAALTTPLSLSATPAELDAEFAATVAGVTASHRSLAEQAEATKSILDAAKTTQSSKATKALTKAAKPADIDDADDEADGDTEGAPSAKDDSQTGSTTVPSTPVSTGTDLASLL